MPSRRAAPADADTFALEVVFVIVSLGMRWRVAGPIYAACSEALLAGRSAAAVFGHPGKARAIDAVWQQRTGLFVEFANSADLLAFCASLPFVGQVAKYHLAKNLGGDLVKPDVHLVRLATTEDTTPWQLCHGLALATRDREATIDTVLWRTCEVGLVRSRAYFPNG